VVDHRAVGGGAPRLRPGRAVVLPSTSAGTADSGRGAPTSCSQGPIRRTAAWLAGLDGGLDYLRSVLVDDSLGIGTELDAATAAHVERYEDEWAAVLADPERLCAGSCRS
jgi:hypothetical protein